MGKRWWVALFAIGCSGRTLDGVNRTFEPNDAGTRHMDNNRDAGPRNGASQDAGHADAGVTRPRIPLDAAFLGTADAPVDERTIACRHSFLRTHDSRCGSQGYGPKELEKLWPAYARECRAEFDLPGVTYTAADAEACNQATDISGCEAIDMPVLECDFRGSLPGGAPCVYGIQCRSGRCDQRAPPDGGILWETCGTCRRLAKVGETCADAGCEKGSVCLLDFKTFELRCLAISEQDVGAVCDGILTLCRPGSYCSASHVCTIFPSLGEPCELGRCTAPYVCGLDSVCRKPAAIGESCYPGCEPGLGCGRAGSCAVLEWAEPGASCDQDRACYLGLCLEGSCQPVVEEGEPCSDNFSCGPGYVCAVAEPGATQGRCMLPAAVACR